MKNKYLILVLAHSVHGRIKRLHVPHYVFHVLLCVVLFGSIAAIGLLSSYARMVGKTSQFNELRAENQALQRQNERLKQAVQERNVQLASLGELATEVSIAYGIKRAFTGHADQPGASATGANFSRVVNQYDFLQSVRLSPGSAMSPWYWLENTVPSLWPVRGSLSSAFGRRTDPFDGRGAFHPGVDMSARRGTAVVAAADGVIEAASWSGGYGKRIVLNHGRNRLSTHYAHLSEILARPGQVVRRGEVIGRVGSTGKVTSAHLHYEVRYRGNPVNPYKYLKRSTPTRSGFRFTD